MKGPREAGGGRTRRRATLSGAAGTAVLAVVAVVGLGMKPVP
ncbi:MULTISPECIES: hypothetical protein [unclassified Streptomyces]|nr:MULTISPECIES: hypothetical protein [unclassified Streptomyces]